MIQVKPLTGGNLHSRGRKKILKLAKKVCVHIYVHRRAPKMSFVMSAVKEKIMVTEQNETFLRGSET